ncbi:MAG: DsbA family protein [Rhodospirillaceae bacterium]|nr:DsbA family protein [Rhodospirillaceae bacterium]
MKQIDWYFDYVSPFAYLQSRRLQEFHGAAEIRPIPVLFAGLLNAFDGLGPAELPTKRIWTYRICQFNAEQWGIPFRMPPAHPFSPLRLLRLTIALNNDAETIDAIYRFIWADGRDPDTEWPALMKMLAIGDAAERISDDSVKLALKANTDAAIAAGVYGVPTLMIDGEAFWGVDGTDFAKAYLADPSILESDAMTRIDTLPNAADRRRRAGVA